MVIDDEDDGWGGCGDDVDSGGGDRGDNAGDDDQHVVSCVFNNRFDYEFNRWKRHSSKSRSQGYIGLFHSPGVHNSNGQRQ